MPKLVGFSNSSLSLSCTQFSTEEGREFLFLALSKFFDLLSADTISTWIAEADMVGGVNTQLVLTFAMGCSKVFFFTVLTAALAY